MKYLVDTDVLIDFLRGVKGSYKFVSRIIEEGSAISAITVAELLSGKRTADPARRRYVLALISKFTVIPLDREIGITAGELRRDYGVKIGDAAIAATALAHNLTLITRNIRDFSRIPNLAVKVPDYARE